MKKIHKGDVVILKSNDFVSEVGSLGLVTDVTDIAVQVIFVDNKTGYQNYTYDIPLKWVCKSLEVIDHIDEPKNVAKAITKLRVGDVCESCGVQLDGVGVTSNGRRICNKCNDKETDDFEECVYKHLEEKPLQPKKYEENGYDYWLEQSKDNSLYLMKQCKTCKSLHPQMVRMIGESHAKV